MMATPTRGIPPVGVKTRPNVTQLQFRGQRTQMVLDQSESAALAPTARTR